MWLDLLLLEDLVVDRQHRAARIAENELDALIGQRLQNHLRAGHRACHVSDPFSCKCPSVATMRRAPAPFKPARQA